MSERYTVRPYQASVNVTVPAKGFRRLKAYKQLPALKAALLAHQSKHAIRNTLEETRKAE